ncbi:MAG: hypothetical protein MHM6MM_009573, partial [Cercozoa sp. M6MM]
CGRGGGQAEFRRVARKTRSLQGLRLDTKILCADAVGGHAVLLQAGTGQESARKHRTGRHRVDGGVDAGGALLHHRHHPALLGPRGRRRRRTQRLALCPWI